MKTTLALVSRFLLTFWSIEILVDANASLPANSSVGGEGVAYLQYQPATNILWVYTLPVSDQPSIRFKREPAANRQALYRGWLQVGRDANQFIPFAWDESQGRLYLDLNRNLDLGDDRGGVFVSRSRSLSQMFTNVPLSLNTGSGAHSALVNLYLYSATRLNAAQPRALALVRSFWQGKITLQGADWQVGLLENPLGKNDCLEGGRLLLRPWAARHQSPNFRVGSSDAFQFSRHLFIRQTAYHLECHYESAANRAAYRLELQEYQPEVGSLRFAGTSLERVTLEKPGETTVVLDAPASTAMVPQGTYSKQTVWFKKGKLELYRQSTNLLTVNKQGTALLAAGAPLTNSVSITRRGDTLALSYQLLGAGEGNHLLLTPDRGRPPGFVIRQGRTVVATGKFAFG